MNREGWVGTYKGHQSLLGTNNVRENSRNRGNTLLITRISWVFGCEFVTPQVTPAQVITQACMYMSKTSIIVIVIKG